MTSRQCAAASINDGVRDRQRIRKRVLRHKPYLVVGSPKCTDYSNLTVKLQRPKMDREELRRRLAEREVLLRFAVEMTENAPAGIVVIMATAF